MLLVTWNLWWKMEMRVLESAGQEEVEFGCFTEVMEVYRDGGTWRAT